MSNSFMLCCRSHFTSILPILLLFIFNRLQYPTYVESFIGRFLSKITATYLCMTVQWNFAIYVLYFRLKYLLTWKKDGFLPIFTKNSPLLRISDCEMNPNFFITTCIYWSRNMYYNSIFLWNLYYVYWQQWVY